MSRTPSGRTSAPSLLTLLAAGLLVPAVALAKAPSTGIAACAGIAADLDRLACYDRASGRKVAAKPPTKAPTAAPAPAEGTALAAPAAPQTAAEAPADTAASGSRIDAAWGFRPDSDEFQISLYRPNYVLAARYSDRPNEAPFDVLFNAVENPDAELESTEAEFQLSFKARVWATDDRRCGAWAAYTQRSQWQVYNGDLSAPFRETNYEPELFVSYNPGLSFAGIDWRLLNVGYNHQSNGRSDPISRSWDRAIAEIGIERGDFALLVRPWVILDDGGDDNPDIDDYMGWGDVTALYKKNGHSVSLMARGKPGGKGTVQLTWMSPPILGPLRAYVEAFSGYGDSLIDYNWYQNTIGIGVALNDFLDRPGQPR